jgi:hypothetical protein
MAFLERIAQASGPAAKKLAIMHLKPKLEPYLRKTGGLEWADVLPALEEVDSIDELQEAVADPAGFLERLASVGGAAAKKLAIMYLRQPLDGAVSDVVVEFESEFLAAPEHSALQGQEARNSADCLRRESVLGLDHADGDDVLPVLDAMDSAEELKEHQVSLYIGGAATHSAEDHDQRLRRLSAEAIKTDVDL